MRFENWGRLSWWQRSCIAMTCTVAAACVLALFLTIFIAAAQNSPLLPSMSWLTFTAFPLVIVVMIASFVRLQQRINIRSPQSREEPDGLSGASDR